MHTAACCTLASLLLMTSLSAADATYTGLQPDQFMKTWLVLKPIPVPAGKSSTPPDEAAQRKAFAGDQLDINSRPRAGMKVTIAGQEFEWKALASTSETIDLKKDTAPSNYAIAYAWAEIEMPANTKAMLGVGSDDGLKMWLNGKLVHSTWVARSTEVDDDAVPVEFQAGRNQLLLKIQNIEGDWGFACRLMGPQSRSNQFITEAGSNGDVETIRQLLDSGLIDVNARNDSGLSAVHSARIKGNADVAAFLIGHGADLKAGLPATDQLLDAHISHLVHAGDPAVSILVARDGKILFQKAYGLADRERKVAATPQTRIRIGSITKQFTASAILKLQEEGKLSVTDKLSKYIPDFPRGDEVTLTHLLTHTSGIHNYTDRPGFVDSVTKPITLPDLVQLFKKDPYDFDPGKKWRYDNSGYTLLAFVIRKVSGETFADYLQKTFFVPLGMNDTRVRQAYAQLSNEALGYKYDGDGKFSRAVDWNLSRVSGAGDIDSTVGDLFRWNEAVFNGKVLSEASLKAAFTPVSMTNPEEKDPTGGYGFGWGIVTLRGAQEITHTGGLPGYSSFLTRLPREKFTVAVLANALPVGPGAEPASLGQEAVEFYLGEQLAPRSSTVVTTSISSKALDAIAGRYDYGQAVMRVTIGDGRAYAQLSGQPRYEIFPKSETEFFWKIVDAQVTFVKDDSGKVVKAIHHQNGNTINAPRIEFPAVDTEILDAILGKYDYGQGKAILTVTRDGDQLYAQLTGQPKFDIYPKSPTDFYWKVVDAQVSFMKDASGKVTKAIHHQNGHTIEAPKIE